MKRICTALAALAVTLPAHAQQFTMKLSCPTVGKDCTLCRDPNWVTKSKDIKPEQGHSSCD